jgi:hypothetical protein
LKEPTASIFRVEELVACLGYLYPKDGGCIFPQNSGKLLLDWMTSYPRRQYSVLFMVTAMRTSNLTLLNLFYIKLAGPFSLIRNELSYGLVFVQ